MENHDLKRDLALYRAVLAAGFGLANVQSMEGRDGYCWSTVLTFGKKKILRASNGGFGGPDEIEQMIDTKGSFRDLSAAREFVEKLMSIPEVVANVRDYEISLEEGCWHYAVDRVHKERIAAGSTETEEQTREVLKLESQAKVASLKNDPLKYDDETVARIISALSDIRSVIAKMRRTCKTSIAWFKKGTSDGSYVHIKCADTPENRTKIEGRYGADIDGYVADAIAGL